MKKVTKSKLVLSSITVRTLVTDELTRAAGGISREDCHSMQRACGIGTGGICAVSEDICKSGAQIASCACA